MTQERKPKGPFRTVFSTESDLVVFYYSVVNLLRILIHYSKHSKSVQNVVIHYIFSSESLRVVNSLRIVNSLRVLFLVHRGPLGRARQAPPSYGCGRYGFGFFGPRIAFCATGAMWGRATPFFYHFSVHLSSVLGRTELCHEVWTPGPQIISNENHHLALLEHVRKNSLNTKFLGGIFLGHPGPRRRDIPDKNFMQVAFFCCFRQGVAGMSQDLGRDVPDLEKLYARKLWADFFVP